jgi:predicted secreted hydrolase
MLLIVLGAGLTPASAAGARPSDYRTEASPPVRFPADQAAHPRVQNEWWYVVGHLRAGRRTFGYEVTIFRFSHVRPPGFTSPVTLYRTDIAITDETSQRFSHRITYYFPQSGSFSARTLDARVGNASLRGSSPRDMTLRASFAGGAIDLHLSSRRAPLYVGGRGYLTFSNGYTYYYSLTDLASRGSLGVGGRTYQVQGDSWLDHQWGDWTWTGGGGWTWMAWQLANGVQLSVFDVHSGGRHDRMASALLADGSLRIARAISIASTGTWRSPHDGAVYPSGWLVRIPALRVTMRVTPTVRDQEMTATSDLRTSYWEGSSLLRGTFAGRQVTGLGYTELTGYADHAA